MDCPNVAAFGPEGSMYVTCSGEDGRPEIVRVSPGGEHVERWTDAAPAYPNGALVTPDGSALVVVEARAERIVSVPILADGSAGQPSLSRRCPIPTPTASPSTPTATTGSPCIVPTASFGSTRAARWSSSSTTTSRRRSTRRRTSPGSAGGLDRAVVANVGDTSLSIADVGVAGMPLHLPDFD